MKRKLFVIFGLNALCAVLLFCVLSLPRCAFAQDVQVDPGPGVTVAAASLITEAQADQLFNSVAIGDWWAVAAVAVFVLTQAIKSGAASGWFSGRYPKVSAFFADPRVLFLLPFVLAGLPAVFTAVKSGQPFTLSLLIRSIITEGGGAKGIFFAWKNFTEKPTPVPPAAALLLLLPLLSFSSCSTVTPFIVTGDSVDALGKQYTETASAMFAGCSKDKIEPDTCRAWRDFSERFKPGYDLAVTGWKSAAVVEDAAKRGRVAASVGALGAELGTFIVDLQRLKLLPGGTP